MKIIGIFDKEIIIIFTDKWRIELRRLYACFLIIVTSVIFLLTCFKKFKNESFSSSVGLEPF